MKDYVSKIRSRIGKDKFIHPAVRIIVENSKSQYLFIERADNGKIGIPAGAFEEDETIEECVRREVKEETGLTIKQLEVIGMSTNPCKESVKYDNGDKIQYFTIEFYSNNWDGELRVEDNSEVKSVKFMDASTKNRLPTNELSAFESLEYFKINRKIMLK